MSDNTPTAPADRRAAWPKAAGAVVAAIIVAAIVITWQIATRPAPADQPAGSPPATATVDEGRCPSAEVVMSGTVTVAPEAIWSLVGTVAAPEVDGAGPLVVDPDGYRHCYARTPTGALVAALNLGAMGSDPALAQRIAQDGLVPGALRDRLLSTPAASSGSGGSAQFAGFRMVSYDGATAVVDVGMRAANGGYGSIMAELVWHEGDWRYSVRGEGAGQELAVTYSWPPSLTGYIPWSGV